MKKIIIIFIIFLLLVSGCASVQEKQEAGSNTREQNAQTEKKDPYYESDAIIVHASRYDRIQMKRREAIRRHNEDSVGVIAASGITVFTYAVTNAYFVGQGPWGLVTIYGITAIVAFISAEITRAIYDRFNPAQGKQN